MSPEETAAVALGADAVLRELIPVLDIPVQIVIEVGRLRLRVRELIQLGPNSVIELKKSAGDPFDVCVNGVPVARCEVILVEQSTGVRVVDVHKAGGLTL
jgi:flagellar motor switch protein FliN/FliY